MSAVKNWLDRKLEEPSATIGESRTVSKEFRRFVCGEMFAGITLTVRPANSLSIQFKVEPSCDDLRWAVEDAVFGALLTEYRKPILRVAVTIDELFEKDGASNYLAFKVAATEAMKDVLGGVRSNIVWG